MRRSVLAGVATGCCLVALAGLSPSAAGAEIGCGVREVLTPGGDGLVTVSVEVKDPDATHHIAFTDAYRREHYITAFTIPAAVPGDWGTFCLDVTNDGSTPGVVNVWIPPVEFLDGDSDRALHRDFLISGDLLDPTPVADLSAGDRLLSQRTLAVGETKQVALRWEFPYEAASGNTAWEGEHLIQIALGADIRGQAPEDGQAPPRPPTLTLTGASLGAAFLAAVLVTVGAQLLAGKKNRRTNQ